MKFWEFLYLIGWGAGCGYLAVNILAYAACLVIAVMQFARMPLSTLFGLATAPAIYFAINLALLCTGFYLTTEILDIYKFQREPLFIVFCLLGTISALIPAMTRVTTWHQSLQ
jgi:hypothetical protein